MLVSLLISTRSETDRKREHWLGDWEHSMVRFKDGKPTAIHLSAHSEGHSFPWGIMEKMGDRPVGYAATGSRESLVFCDRQHI